MAVRMFEQKHTMSVFCIVLTVLCVPLFRFVFGQEAQCPCAEIENTCTSTNRFTPLDGRKNRENVALFKKTRVSGVHMPTHTGYGQNAPKLGCLLNNGNRSRNTVYYFNSRSTANCLQTNSHRGPHSWTVNLVQPYTVVTITLVTPAGLERRTNVVRLMVDEEMCNNWPDQPGLPPAIIHMDCRQPVTGRIITVTRFILSKVPDIDANLHYCEIEVWSCADGYYNADCTAKCSAACVNKRCYGNGTCAFGCEVGWRGETCTEGCPTGFYGNGCLMPCRSCQNMSCYSNNGTCLTGCKEGWLGSKCDIACPAGFYGVNCSMLCGMCSNVSCYNNGSCISECEEGWTGDKCEEEIVPEGTDMEIIMKMGLAFIVFLIVLICIVLFKWKKMRKQEEAKEEPQDQEMEIPELEEPAPEEPVEQTPAEEQEKEGEGPDEEQEKEGEGLGEEEEEKEEKKEGEGPEEEEAKEEE